MWGKTNALKIKNLKDSAIDWEEAKPEEKLKKLAFSFITAIFWKSTKSSLSVTEIIQTEYFL